MTHDVFISYSTNDQKIVEGVSHYLEQNGIRCFIAYRDIPKGIDWAEAITEAIENSQLMVVVFSEEFNQTKQVDREIAMCIEEGKPILTFRIQDTTFKGAKKYYLKNLNWIDAFPNPEESFGTLLASVKSLLGTMGKTTTPILEGRSTLKKPSVPIEQSEKQKPDSHVIPDHPVTIWIMAVAGVLLLFLCFWLINRIDGRKGTTPSTDNQISSSVVTESTLPTDNQTGSSSRHPAEPEMILVQGGTFSMGCTDEQGGDCMEWEKPVHQVTVNSFYIGKYEITQGQWKAIMDRNPSNFTKGDNYPVENVGWDDLQEFIHKLNVATGKNYRLPTEAEWEYAARGGNNSKGYKYSGNNTMGIVGWYKDNSENQTHAVGTKLPNELDIYDMSGNVWEWCSDWYDTYSGKAQTDPQGPSSGIIRVKRGGSWNSIAMYSRVSSRLLTAPNKRDSDLGFRLASSSP